MTSPALNDFGKAVRKARTAKGWTLEILAHEALGNQERKSYVSAVENGRKRLSALTIQKFARALDLDDAVVDPLLGGATAEDEPQSQTDTDADRLSAQLDGVRTQLRLSESLAIALAYKYAEGNPTDFESALRGLENALEVAARERARLSSNVDEAVAQILKEVEQLNEDGQVSEASALLARALEEAEEEEARAGQDHPPDRGRSGAGGGGSGTETLACGRRRVRGAGAHSGRLVRAWPRQGAGL